MLNLASQDVPTPRPYPDPFRLVLIYTHITSLNIPCHRNCTISLFLPTQYSPSPTPPIQATPPSPFPTPTYQPPAQDTDPRPATPSQTPKSCPRNPQKGQKSHIIQYKTLSAATSTRLTVC